MASTSTSTTSATRTASSASPRTTTRRRRASSGARAGNLAGKPVHTRARRPLGPALFVYSVHGRGVGGRGVQLGCGVRGRVVSSVAELLGDVRAAGFLHGRVRA